MMKIIDLDYLDNVNSGQRIEGGVYVSSSSSSISTNGFSGSTFKSIAIGRSFAYTFSNVKQIVVSLPHISYSFSSSGTTAIAGD